MTAPAPSGRCGRIAGFRKCGHTLEQHVPVGERACSCCPCIAWKPEPAADPPNPYREGTEEHDEIEALRAATFRRGDDRANECCDVHAMAPEEGHHENCPENNCGLCGKKPRDHFAGGRCAPAPEKAPACACGHDWAYHFIGGCSFTWPSACYCKLASPRAPAPVPAPAPKCAKCGGNGDWDQKQPRCEECGGNTFCPSCSYTLRDHIGGRACAPSPEGAARDLTADREGRLEDSPRRIKAVDELNLCMMDRKKERDAYRAEKARADAAERDALKAWDTHTAAILAQGTEKARADAAEAEVAAIRERLDACEGENDVLEKAEALAFERAEKAEAELATLRNNK